MAQNEKPAENSQAEAMSNLVNFMEMLITLDRQHQEWLAKQKDQPKEAM